MVTVSWTRSNKVLHSNSYSIQHGSMTNPRSDCSGENIDERSFSPFLCSLCSCYVICLFNIYQFQYLFCIFLLRRWGYYCIVIGYLLNRFLWTSSQRKCAAVVTDAQSISYNDRSIFDVHVLLLAYDIAGPASFLKITYSRLQVYCTV